MRLLWEPLDVLMFRSSRPFYRGESTIAEAGPISPSTFAGAIKTKLLLTHNSCPPKEWWKNPKFQEIAELIGSPENEGKINVRCVMFADLITCEEYFQLPLDIVFSDSMDFQEKDRRPMLLKPLEHKIFELDKNLFSLASQSFYVKTEPFYLSRTDLIQYLQGDAPENWRFYRASELYEYERRTGIGLNRARKISEEGMIYVAEFLRLKSHVGFMTWLDGIDAFPEEGLLRLGGEGKVCVCRRLKDQRIDPTKIIEEVNKSHRFKLYFATPAVFCKNDSVTWWRPNIEMLEKTLGVELMLVSTALAKPVILGGWDAAKGKQKPLRRAIPAGTVYFFKIKEGMKVNGDLELPLQMSDQEAKSGFGSAFMGVWKNV